MKKNLYKLFKESKNFSTKWKSYFPIYEEIFKKYINKKVTFVEVGVANGGSLFMWKKFFGKKSRIIGIDLNPEVKRFEKEGFEIFIGDQQDKYFWKDFYKKVGNVDVILDDGGHKNLQQISTIAYSLPYIKNNGMVVIEDTMTSYIKKSFGNPSIFSFINFAYQICDSIHRRNPMLKNLENIYSKKVFSIKFFESIVVLDIDKRKCKINKLIFNSKKFLPFTDYRHKGNNLKLINYLKKIKILNFFISLEKLGKIIGNRNIFFYFTDKVKLLRLFNNVSKNNPK
jgi:hypothetical protein